MPFNMSPQNMTMPQMAGKQHSTMTENPIPTWTEVRATVPQTIDASMIANAICKNFEVQLKLVDSPVYIKAYP